MGEKPFHSAHGHTQSLRFEDAAVLSARGVPACEDPLLPVQERESMHGPRPTLVLDLRLQSLKRMMTNFQEMNRHETGAVIP